MKIRELLNSELDDGLLDDDNASFSSHDLRSSGYSRDTPYSEDFTEQEHQTFFSGPESKKLIPSARGAFERPPLITQRAFHFINGSGQNQDSNTGRINQPYNYDSGHQYQENYDHPGYNEYREQESPFDGQVDEYGQGYGDSEGGLNYQTLPDDDDDVDEGFEQHGNYHPRQEIQGQFPSQQESYNYHHQSHYPGANFNEDNNGSGAHDFNEDYGGYTEEETPGHGQNHYDHRAENVNGQSHYRIDAPGNYRVQYRAQHQPIPRISDRGSDEQVTKMIEVASGFSEDGSQDVQLQILYKARGRKIEELTRKLENQEEEMAKEIRVLNHQNALLKGTCMTPIIHPVPICSVLIKECLV